VINNIKKMGQGPLKCSKCNENMATNKIYYENIDVTNRWTENNPYGDDINGLKSHIMNFNTTFDTIDFASKQAKNIRDVVGKIDISLGTNIDMDQLLCDDCLKGIDFKKLKGTNWKWYAEHTETGYFRSQLP
jgi:hypothetical protein